MDKGLALLKEIRNSREVSWELLFCALEVALERKNSWSDDDKSVFMVIVASLLGSSNAKSIPPLSDGSYISTRMPLSLSKENVGFLVQSLLDIFPKECLWEPASVLNNQSILERALLDDMALENASPVLDVLPSQYFKTTKNPKLEDAVWLMIEKGKRLGQNHTLPPVSDVFEILDKKGFDLSMARNNIPLMRYCINHQMWETYLKQGGDVVNIKVDKKPLWQYLASPQHRHLRSHILKWAEENTQEKEIFLQEEYFKDLDKYTSGRYATLATLKSAVSSPDLKWWELSNDKGQNPLMLLMSCHENSLSLFKAKRCAPMISKRDNLDRSIAFYTLGSECSSEKMKLVFTDEQLLRPSSIQGGLLTQMVLAGENTLFTRNSKLFSQLIKEHSYDQWFEKIENCHDAFEDMALGKNPSEPFLYHLYLLSQRFFNECPDSFVRSVMVLATGLSSSMGASHQRASREDFEKFCQENPCWDERIFDMLNRCKDAVDANDLKKIKTTIEKYYISKGVGLEKNETKVSKKM